jgi:hypothetical protein
LQQKLTKIPTVWFIYPETANVRLEDMNSIFGDATSVMPTPETLAEAESLFSGNRSPVPELDIRRGGPDIGANSAIPGLDIDPPPVQMKDGRPMLHRQESSSSRRSQGEGLGGWITNMVARARGGGSSSGGGEDRSDQGSYKRVGQDED